MDTLKLSSNWDLMADANGNIAVATGSEAIIQDVSSAIRLFIGELWYDTTQGIPYFSGILGQGVNRALIQSAMEEAALAVPGVVKVQVTLNELDRKTRLLTGSVKVIDTNGQELGATF
jgi:hypothetical protein